MALAAPQVHLLALTGRKADCERAITAESMNKMALTREMTELAQDYNSKLKNKQVSYYANGQYNLINETYLMGNAGDFSHIYNDSAALKNCNSMILTDYRGNVVLSNEYASAIAAVVGASAIDANGRGKTFSKEYIPDILAKLPGSPCDAATYRAVMNNGNYEGSYIAHPENSATGESTGEEKEVDITPELTEAAQKILDFYLPIFSAAAANGWTAEYNREMALSETYISDALVSGAFQLVTVADNGEYDEGGSLTYFLTRGYVEANSSSDVREELTAWYNAEKARISEKETFSDLRINELSTELEAIKAEMQSIQTFIDDAISSVFDWGSA
ncbi:hypothetical protein IJD34_07640 [bacterium]|nr:hypothetical protein [bacterium]